MTKLKKEQKTQLIEEIAEHVDSAQAIYAIDYRGISVPQVAELRAKLRDADATLRIVKNTLTERALDSCSAPSADQLKAFVAEGPTALTFIQGDPAVAAKALDSFAKENNVLDFKGGTLGADVLTADDIRGIAKLPARDRLNAQLAGVVASPLTTLVRGLGSMVSGLAVALGQVMQQKEGEAPQPQEAEPKAEQEAEPKADASETQEQPERKEDEQEAGQ
ncbi:MAG: 50S ribosomal protein L10 [Solirubrobacterales bacterium]